MVPSSVAKMKRLAPAVPPAETTKLPVLLNTMPVGAATAPAGLLGGVGIVTTIGEFGGNATPSPVYIGETPVPLSTIQMGPAAPALTIPQGLTRFGSAKFATPGIS